MKLVKAVIQVLGPQKMPTVPGANEDIRSWYRKVRDIHETTTVIFISNAAFICHRPYNPSFPQPSHESKRFTKARNHHTHWCVNSSDSFQNTHTSLDERRQIKLISTGLPAIQEIVAQSIADKIPVNNATVINPPTAKAVE